jgi:UTP--glucose-1-phosphate uridylyltransferase
VCTACCTGDRLDYLRSIVRLACERSDLGPEFTAWLREFAADLPAPGPAPRHDASAGRDAAPEAAGEAAT